MIKLAILRDNQGEKCPFLLPIPSACSKVGKAIFNMKPGQDNSQLFIWEATGEKCPFANHIVKNTVDCSYENESRTESDINPSPLFEKPFSGSVASGINTFPHLYYSGDTPLNKGPYYHMYSIEMVASQKEKKK